MATSNLPAQKQRLAELERILKFDFDRDARAIAKVEYIRLTQPQPLPEVA